MEAKSAKSERDPRGDPRGLHILCAESFESGMAFSEEEIKAMPGAEVAEIAELPQISTERHRFDGFRKAKTSRPLEESLKVTNFTSDMRCEHVDHVGAATFMHVLHVL